MSPEQALSAERKKTAPAEERVIFKIIQEDRFTGGREVTARCRGLPSVMGRVHGVYSRLFLNLIDVKILNEFGKVAPDTVMPEAPLVHFLDRFFLGPPLDRYAVDRAYKAGAVGAVPISV